MNCKQDIVIPEIQSICHKQLGNGTQPKASHKMCTKSTENFEFLYCLMIFLVQNVLLRPAVHICKYLICNFEQKLYHFFNTFSKMKGLLNVFTAAVAPHVYIAFGRTFTSDLSGYNCWLVRVSLFIDLGFP